MRPKEAVVVFEGEDNFVLQKPVVFSKSAGKASHVSADGSTPEGIAFKEYMDKEGQPIEIPTLAMPDFCARALAFMQTNGNGKATPQQVMNVYQLHAENCVEKPKDNPIDAPLPAVPLEQLPVVEAEGLPAWNTLDCDTLDKEIKKAEAVDTSDMEPAKIRAFSISLSSAKALQVSKCQQPPQSIAPVITPQTLISTDDPTFGARPSSGATTEPADKKSNNIWLLLAAAVVVYLIADKK